MAEETKENRWVCWVRAWKEHVLGKYVKPAQAWEALDVKVKKKKNGKGTHHERWDNYYEFERAVLIDTVTDEVVDRDAPE